jgi:hypothetical protein
MNRCGCGSPKSGYSHIQRTSIIPWMGLITNNYGMHRTHTQIHIHVHIRYAHACIHTSTFFRPKSQKYPDMRICTLTHVRTNIRPRTRAHTHTHTCMLVVILSFCAGQIRKQCRLRHGSSWHQRCVDVQGSVC